MGAIMVHEIGGRQTPEAFVHGLSAALEVGAAIAIALVALTVLSGCSRRATDGRILNSFLRPRLADDPPDARYFAGEMLCAVGRARR